MLEFILNYGISIFIFCLFLIAIIRGADPINTFQPNLRKKEETVIEEIYKP